jgi:hypothetical protein
MRTRADSAPTGAGTNASRHVKALHGAVAVRDASRMTDTTQQPEDEQQPGLDQLTEPSTEKEPDEVPLAPTPHDPDPDHRAVGIGVIGGPQADTDDSDTDDSGRDDDEP